MRKPPRLYAHDAKGMIPRMSWSPHNLYNLIARSTVPQRVAEITFNRVSLSMYQQRWRSKRFLRGYHGDWIGERRFRRWFLPTSVPRFEDNKLTTRGRSTDGERSMTEQDRLPVTSLFLREVERRLDTVVFRCCFARSAREARALIVQGKVKLNGVRTTFAGTLLNPGDLLSVEASAVPMLSKTLAKQVAEQREEASEAVEEVAAEEEEVEAKSEEESQAAENVEKESGVDAKEEGLTTTQEENVDSETAGEASSDVQETVKKVERQNKGKAKQADLPPGVFPFTLPPFAAPFLFVPPYLEVSYTTCSAVYIRHPTITPAPRTTTVDKRSQVAYHTDLPSPYPATGDIFSLAWEMYVRDAPRIRSDVRRLRLEARVGRNGLRTARARDQWRKVLAIRRKRDRQLNPTEPAATTKSHNTQFVVGGRTAVKRNASVNDALRLSTVVAEAQKANNDAGKHRMSAAA